MFEENSTFFSLIWSLTNNVSHSLGSIRTILNIAKICHSLWRFATLYIQDIMVTVLCHSFFISFIMTQLQDTQYLIGQDKMKIFFTLYKFSFLCFFSFDELFDSMIYISFSQDDEGFWNVLWKHTKTDNLIWFILGVACWTKQWYIHTVKT